MDDATPWHSGATGELLLAVRTSGDRRSVVLLTGAAGQMLGLTGEDDGAAATIRSRRG